MQLKKKVLSVLAIVILAILGTTFGLSVALADTSERAIPAIGAASPSAGTIHVTWETPGDVDTLNSYRVSWSQDDSGMTSYREANSSTGGNAYPDAPATSYTITGLDAGAYYVLVRSRYDDGDNGAFKKAGPVEVTDTTQTDQQEEDSTPTATPEPTATPAPTATPQQQAEPDRNIPTIGASSPSAGAIDIIWGAPSETGDLNSYRVSWSQDASGMTSYREANSSTGGNAYPDAPAASYTITGLDAGAYYVLVRARYDDGDNGAWKKAGPVQVAATPEPTPEATPEPGAITGLEMTSSGAGRLWIEWDEPDPEPSGYRLNWARVGRSFPAAGSGYGGNISYPYNEINFSNLVDRGVTYKFRVRALYNADPDNSWSGPWSEVATRRVRDNPPGAPTDLSVDSATHDGVALTWSAPSHTGLTGYRILRGPDAGALETIVDDTGDLSLSYTDTTAADDATHHYAVMALSLDGDGRQSATVSATTPPRTPEAPLIEGAPAAPAGLTARLDGTGGVTLGWTDPDDDAITGYRILRGDDALSMRVIVEDTGSAAVSYTDTGLAANLTQRLRRAGAQRHRAEPALQYRQRHHPGRAHGAGRLRLLGARLAELDRARLGRHHRLPGAARRHRPEPATPGQEHRQRQDLPHRLRRQSAADLPLRGARPQRPRRGAAVRDALRHHPAAHFGAALREPGLRRAARRPAAAGGDQPDHDLQHGPPERHSSFGGAYDNPLPDWRYREISDSGNPLNPIERLGTRSRPEAIPGATT